MTHKEDVLIEQLAEEAKLVFEPDFEKRELKEKRGAVKEMLYDGSKKLKHKVPKGIRTT